LLLGQQVGRAILFRARGAKFGQALLGFFKLPLEAVQQLHEVLRGNLAELVFRKTLEKLVVSALHELVKDLKILALRQLKLAVKGFEKAGIFEPARKRSRTHPGFFCDGRPAEPPFDQQVNGFPLFGSRQGVCPFQSFWSMLYLLDSDGFGARLALQTPPPIRPGARKEGDCYFGVSITGSLFPSLQQPEQVVFVDPVGIFDRIAGGGSFGSGFSPVVSEEEEIVGVDTPVVVCITGNRRRSRGR